MKTHPQHAYERPQIETMPSSRIIELLGPVSCGSMAKEPSDSIGLDSMLGAGQHHFSSH
jgi:hypothetical protein